MGNSPKKELLRFLSEDIQCGDITSALLTNQKIKAKIISRQQGIVAGIEYIKDEWNCHTNKLSSFTDQKI